MSSIRFNSYTRGYEWLSNFFLTPIEYADAIWPSVEHAYQAAKTTDPEQREAIRAASTASAAKKLGKHVVDLVPHWNERRVFVMAELIHRKFTPGSDLAARLLATADAKLVHYSPWDKFWGVGTDGHGENHLGRILMECREWLLLRDSKIEMRLR